MKKIFRKLLGGALLFGLTMSLTSCDPYLDDILGEWSRPTPNPVTPTVEEVIKYGFKVTDLAGVDRTEAVTSLKMRKADGTLVAEAEVSGGKITITNTKLTEAGITAAADFWFEAEIASQPYIAKVNIDPTTLSPETDKTLAMATLGDVILADGKFAVSTTAETKVAMIAYVGSDACEAGDAPYNHGLALAMNDANDGNKALWCSATDNQCLTLYDAGKLTNDMAGIANTTTLVSDGHTHAAATAARGFKYDAGVTAGAHPDGTSEWFLPSAGQWDKMNNACKNVLGTKNTYEDLCDAFSTRGGTNMKTASTGYWLSTEFSASQAWGYGYGLKSYLQVNKNISGGEYYVRACLAF